MTRLVNLTTEDRLALLDLVHRYAACVDDRDLAGAAALFSADGVLVRPDPPAHLEPVHRVVGPAAIERALHALDEVPVTAHEIVGVVLDPGDLAGSARGRVACVAHHLGRSEAGLSDLVWHLHYLDSYSLGAGGWRIDRRELHVDFIETRPVRRSRNDPQEAQ